MLVPGHMMLASEAFPRAYRRSLDASADFWSAPVDLARDFERIFGRIAEELGFQMERNDEALDAVATAWVLDLRDRQRDAPAADKGLALILLLHATIGPLLAALRANEMLRMHDWFIEALSETPQMGRQSVISIERLQLILTPDPRIEGLRLLILLEWAKHFFYYSRVRATFPGFAELLYSALEKRYLSLLRMPHPGIVQSALMAVNWTFLNQPERQWPLMAAIEAVYRRNDTPAEVAALICTAFATRLGEVTSDSPHTWAARALALHRDDLIEHQRLNMVCTVAAGTDGLERWKDEIRREVEASWEWRRGTMAGEPDSPYVYAGRLSILTPLFSACCDTSDSDFLMETLAAWYRKSAETRRRRPTITFIPTREPAALFVEGEACSYGRPAGVDIVSISRITNAFTGSALTVEGTPDYDVLPDAADGQLHPEHGPTFEEQVRLYYGTDDPAVRAFLHRHAACDLLLLPTAQHPLQACLLKDSGVCPPMVASLQEPAEERPFRRVGIWLGGAPSDEAEMQALRAIFSAAGIEVREYGGEAASKAAFQAFYEDSSLDGLWVVSHGHFDHYAPHEASLQIRADGELVNLETLRGYAPPASGRRVLVVNACSGGAAGLVGGISNLGIGPALADRHQAVIAHLWPVEGVAAAAFGVFLAANLASGQPVGKAFAAACLTFMSGSEGVRAALAGQPGTNLVLALFDTSSIDWENIAVWGSPIFLV